MENIFEKLSDILPPGVILAFIASILYKLHKVYEKTSNNIEKIMRNDESFKDFRGMIYNDVQNIKEIVKNVYKEIYSIERNINSEIQNIKTSIESNLINDNKNFEIYKSKLESLKNDITILSEKIEKLTILINPSLGTTGFKGSKKERLSE